MKLAKSTIASAIANGFAQAGLTSKDGVHGAVFCEQGMFIGTDPIRFSIKVMAIQGLRG